MNSRLLSTLILLIAGMTAPAQTPKGTTNARIPAETLAPIPDAQGFAGSFAGVSGGALVVAGGSNITGDKWAEPLAKKWYDSVFVLERPDGKWRTDLKLPRPLGYGFSVSVDDSMLCFGGSDANRHYADGFRLQWKKGKLVTTPLPPLPMPCANVCGALVGHTIYVAGGLGAPLDTVAMHNFWSLDLDAHEPIWRELEPWPGPGRMHAVAGAFDGGFYLFSGVALSAGPDGKPVREYLRDAYRFTPGAGWKRLADLPRSASAAASPAPVYLANGSPQLLIVSGDDGLNVLFQPVEKHPGFPRNDLLYDPASDKWSTVELVGISRATEPAVIWQKRIVIPSGEVRPRVRTPEVWLVPGP